MKVLLEYSRAHCLILGDVDSCSIVVTRSIGDKCAARLGVECIPEVRHVRLEGDDRYILLATDGLWDGITVEQASILISAMPTAKEAATKLTSKALKGLEKVQISDNITTLVIPVKNSIVDNE